MDYSTYDIGVELLNPSPYRNSNAVTVSFRLVYISEDYTNMQIAMRLTFCVISLIVLSQFATKLLCRVKDWKQHTFGQRSVLVLSLMLFFFNDPWYIVHILSPSFATVVINELQMCVFMAAILVYWLHEMIKLYHSEALQQSTGCI